MLLATILTVTMMPLLPARAADTVAWPLKVASDKHTLTDQSGKPFLMAADTSWTTIAGLSVADAKRVIDIRSAQGFNGLLSVMHNWEIDSAHNGPRGATFLNNNISTPNEAVFKGSDEIIQYAQSKGIVMVLVPYWQYDNHQVTAAQATAYGKWLGARYKNFGNIIWMPGGDDYYSQNANVVAVAEGLDAADPNHLISIHLKGYEEPYGLKDRSWLDIYGYQFNQPGSPYTYESAKKGYQMAPTKPFFNNEPPYEPTAAVGGATSPLQVRQNTWWSLLAGSFGVVYGGPRQTWNPFEVKGVDEASFNRPAAQQFAKIRTVMEKYAWNKLVPDYGASIVKGGGSGTAYVAAGRAADGSLIVAYAPSARTLAVDVSKLSGPGVARWYDPSSGAQVGADSAVAASGTKAFATPGNNAAGSQDWVLVIATAAATPTPTPAATKAPTPTPAPGTRAGDINADGQVNVTDLSLLLGRWQTAQVAADLNGDGTVNVIDLSLLLSNWSR